jgi:hypothetical protein
MGLNLAPSLFLTDELPKSVKAVLDEMDEFERQFWTESKTNQSLHSLPAINSSRHVG